MHLYLAGHLAWYDPQKRSRLIVQLTQPMRLSDLLRDLGIPIAEIAVATVNGVAVELDTAHVADTDRVELFPPVGGGASVRATTTTQSRPASANQDCAGRLVGADAGSPVIRTSS